VTCKLRTSKATLIQRQCPKRFEKQHPPTVEGFPIQLMEKRQRNKIVT